MGSGRIHFVGIGGVGMAGLAVLSKSRGCEVTGCDLHPSPRTRWLESEGVKVFFGHSPSHLDGVDEAIVTPAVPRGEPELAELARRAARGEITLRYRGEALAEMVGGRDSVAVCGSHGKTTTATWTAKLLLALGEDVAWCIGGETGDFPVARDASGPLVVEADESDGTLALYAARTLVVTNRDYDHPDRFPTREEYLACYDAAIAKAGDVVYADALAPDPRFAEAISTLAPHNRANALAAAEVALRRGHSAEAIAKALPSVVSALPDRRFQKIAPGVYADYAHHPTEMRCAIAMARDKTAPGRVLRVLFQPHRYSRTKALAADFPAAFSDADETILCPTYAAFEQPVEGGDVADLYRECREKGSMVMLARSCSEAWEHARNSMEPGDVTLLLGAGDIIDLTPAVAADFPPGAAVPLRSAAKRRTPIGMGSNTWRSELKTDDEYVRVDGPADAPGASLGIPWMAGIPGTVGGWIKMNAGAFGHSISEVLDAVEIDGEWHSAAECGFGYRTSSIRGEIRDFRLKEGWRNLCSGDAADFLARRPQFPPGTKGSVFKNPPGDFAGRLLEEAGAMSMRVGGAYVWDRHANVIVSGPGATASDFLALARLMRMRVLARFGVRLDYEVVGLA